MLSEGIIMLSEGIIITMLREGIIIIYIQLSEGIVANVKVGCRVKRQC